LRQAPYGIDLETEGDFVVQSASGVKANLEAAEAGDKEALQRSLFYLAGGWEHIGGNDGIRADVFEREHDYGALFFHMVNQYEDGGFAANLFKGLGSSKTVVIDNIKAKMKDDPVFAKHIMSRVSQKAYFELYLGPTPNPGKDTLQSLHASGKPLVGSPFASADDWTVDTKVFSRVADFEMETGFLERLRASVNEAIYQRMEDDEVKTGDSEDAAFQAKMDISHEAAHHLNAVESTNQSIVSVIQSDLCALSDQPFSETGMNYKKVTHENFREIIKKDPEFLEKIRGFSLEEPLMVHGKRHKDGRLVTFGDMRGRLGKLMDRAQMKYKALPKSHPQRATFEAQYSTLNLLAKDFPERRVSDETPLAWEFDEMASSDPAEAFRFGSRLTHIRMMSSLSFIEDQLQQGIKADFAAAFKVEDAPSSQVD
jgi:hypothetical protein